MTDTTLPTPTSGRQYPSRADKLSDVSLPNKPTEPSAQDRLEASRAHVRTALLDIAHPPPKPAGSGLANKLLSTVRDIPGAAIVMETAKGWWKDHGQTARTAGQASQQLLKPVAKRYPVGTLGAALAAGAIVIVLKLWR